MFFPAALAGRLWLDAPEKSDLTITQSVTALEYPILTGANMKWAGMFIFHSAAEMGGWGRIAPSVDSTFL